MKTMAIQNMKMPEKLLKLEEFKYPVEILRKLRLMKHLRPREAKRFRRWAFFDF